MLIECKLRRPGGSHIDIDGVDWHFAPRDDGAHVCDVTDEAAIERFLSITEAYCAVDKAPAMVLKNGDEQVDLAALGKKELIAFAKDAGFKVSAMASAQALRESIFEQAKAKG